jgi:hypothetical protein
MLWSLVVVVAVLVVVVVVVVVVFLCLSLFLGLMGIVMQVVGGGKSNLGQLFGECRGHVSKPSGDEGRDLKCLSIASFVPILVLSMHAV